MRRSAATSVVGLLVFACSDVGVHGFHGDTGRDATESEPEAAPAIGDPSRRISVQPDYDALFEACMVPNVRTLCPYLKESDEQDPQCLSDVAALEDHAARELVSLARASLEDGTVGLDALIRAEVPLTVIVDHFVYPAQLDTLGPQLLRDVVVLLGDRTESYFQLRDEPFFRGWYEGRKVYTHGYNPAYAYTFDVPHLYCSARSYQRPDSNDPASLYFTASVRNPARVGDVDPAGSNQGLERENVDGNVVTYRASNIDSDLLPRGSPHDPIAYFYRVELDDTTRAQSFAKSPDRFILRPALDELFDLSHNFVTTTNELLGLDPDELGVEWDHRRRVLYFDGSDFYVIANQVDGHDAPY